MMLKKKISLLLAALAAVTSLVSCSAPTTGSSVTASAGAESYAAFLSDRLGDDMPESTVIAMGEDVEKYGVLLSDFVDDEGYTIRANGGDVVILGKNEAALDRAVRQYVNYGNADCYSYTYGEGYRVKRLTIAGHDISEYSVMLPEENDACHTFAAESLQKYIGKACGIYPDIVEYSDKAEGHFIRLVRVYPEDEMYSVLGDEGFTVSVGENGDLTVFGGYWRGCMYGVFDLLEQYVGWRFIYDPASYGNGAVTEYDYLFEVEHIDIPAGLRYTETADITVRHNIFRGTVYLSEDFRAKRKINSNLTNNRNNYGLIGFASHGLQSAMQDRSFFADFDFDPLVQPCYTDEYLIETAKEYFTMKTQAKIDAGQVLGRDFINVDVAQFDTSDFCFCENCCELFVLDGGNVGPVLNFTNEMARHLRDEFGDAVQVSMLAYMGTTDVPKVTRPEPNVNISFCFFIDDGGFAECHCHPIDGESCTNEDGVSNKPYAEKLRGWSEIAETVTVWYYPGYWNITGVTAPFISLLHDDVKFLIDCGVDGIYDCASGYRMADEKIIPYLLSNLTWDSDITEEEYARMVEEYYLITYGDGYEYLLQYDRNVAHYAQARCWTTNISSTAGDRINRRAVADGFLTDVELFEAALAKAGSATQQKRIEELSLSMYFTGLLCSYDSMYEGGDETSRAKYEEIWDSFMDLAVKHDYRMSPKMSYSGSDNMVWFKDIAADLAEPLDLVKYFEMKF